MSEQSDAMALARQRDLGLLHLRSAERRAEQAETLLGEHFMAPEEIARQRQLGWPDFHPEDYCHRCGRSNITWFTNSEFWKAAVPTITDILCPRCFVSAYEAAMGTSPAWELLPDELTTPWGKQQMREAEARAENAEQERADCRDAFQAFLDDVKAAKDDRLADMGWDEGTAWSLVARAIDRARAFLAGLSDKGTEPYPAAWAEDWNSEEDRGYRLSDKGEG